MPCAVVIWYLQNRQAKGNFYGCRPSSTDGLWEDFRSGPKKTQILLPRYQYGFRCLTLLGFHFISSSGKRFRLVQQCPQQLRQMFKLKNQKPASCQSAYIYIVALILQVRISANRIEYIQKVRDIASLGC